MKVKDVVVDMHQGINTVADKVEYLEEGIPIIQSKNFTRGFLDLEDVRFLGKEDEEKYIEKYNPHIGDILMANIGTIGKSFVISEEQRFLIAWNAFLIKPNHEKVQSDFLKFYFDYLAENHFFDKLLTGGTVKFINKNKIGDINIPDKSLNEQNEICIRLSKMEQIIIKRQMQLELLDCLIKARFVELFGDPKLNEKKWDTGVVSQFYEVKGGKRIPKGMGYADGITAHPYLRATDMKNETILDDDIHYIDDDVFEKIKRYTVKGGDIYLTNVGVNLGMAGVIPDKYDGANLTENAVKLVPKSDVVLDGLFLAHYINSPGIQDYINERKMSVGVPKLAIFRIETMPLILPPMDLQFEFINFCKQIDKSKVAVQKSLEHTQLLFDSLMQGYFG